MFCEILNYFGLNQRVTTFGRILCELYKDNFGVQPTSSGYRESRQDKCFQNHHYNETWKSYLTLVLPRGWLPLPSRFFPCRPKTKKESDLSHLGNLFYILCGHFNEKNGGSTLPGARVSRQSRWVWGGGGGNHLTIENTRTLKNRHFEKKFLLVWSWNLLCMLEMSFPSFMSQKPGEIPIFWQI